MKQFFGAYKVLGTLLMIFSFFMLVPASVSLFYHDSGFIPFVCSFFITFTSGLLVWWVFHAADQELKIRDGFLIVAGFWVVLSVFGSIPFMLISEPHLSFTDSMFESMSGLTTTGASVMTHISMLPKSLLYYRQQLLFLGGMGIVILAVAVLPMIGVGGMQLYRAEATGPVKNTKLKPRMKDTAKLLWLVYVGLAVACIIAYKLCGMSLFDAIGEGFSTVSTGGFSYHDTGFAYYHSAKIDLVASFFMFVSAVGYGLHFKFFTSGKLKKYFGDEEFRWFFFILLAMITLVFLVLLSNHYYASVKSTLVHAIFTVVSVATTTGLPDANFNLWPSFLPFLLMFLALVGGCGGSTSGGIKVIRFLLLNKQGRRELRRILHPQAVIPVKFGNKTLSEDVVSSVWAFFALFIAMYIVFLLFLLATGLDFSTSFGALAACLSNTGSGIRGVFSNYSRISDLAKWVLIFAMLAGRLEIFTLLVIFTRDFWAK